MRTKKKESKKCEWVVINFHQFVCLVKLKKKAKKGKQKFQLSKDCLLLSCGNYNRLLETKTIINSIVPFQSTKITLITLGTGHHNFSIDIESIDKLDLWNELNFKLIHPKGICFSSSILFCSVGRHFFRGPP